VTWSAPEVLDALGPSSTSPRAFGASGAVGNHYVLVLARYSASDPYTTVTDDGGNTWTRRDFAPKSGSAGRRIELWTCSPTAPFTGVSAAFTGSGSALGALVRVPGASGVVDVVLADHRSSSATPASVDITPTEADTLVLAAVQANPNLASTITPGSGWISLVTDVNGPSLVFQIGPPAGVPIGVDWNFGSAAGSGHVIIALQQGAAPPTGPACTVWVGGAEATASVEGVWDGQQVVSITSLEVT